MKIDVLTPYWAEIKLVLRIFYYSINLVNGRPTEGQKMFNICLNIDKNNNIKGKIFSYILLKNIISYLIEKVDDHLLKNEWGYSDNKLKRIFNSFFKLIVLVYRTADFLNFISFTINGLFYSIENRIFDFTYVIFFFDFRKN